MRNGMLMLRLTPSHIAMLWQCVPSCVAYPKKEESTMKKSDYWWVIVMIAIGFAVPPISNGAPPADAPAAIKWPAGLPKYDHIVIVIEENKDYDQIIGNPAAK